MSSSSANFVFEVLEGKDITDEILGPASTLFSENYGVWAKNGKRVKMGPKGLRAQLIPAEKNCEVYCVRALSGGKLAGNVFACRWNEVGGRRICWITQLVVDMAFRGQGLATKMLVKLREGHPTDRGFGLLSSHAAAIRAALRAFGRGLDDVNLDMIKEHAAGIMAASPVDYIKEATLHGSLFGEVEDGSVSSANTNFYVDHTEPLQALAKVREGGIPWPFGELLEGHEFLILVKGKDQQNRNRREDQKSSEF